MFLLGVDVQQWLQEGSCSPGLSLSYGKMGVPMEHPFFSGMWSPGSGAVPIVLEVQRGAAAALLPQPHLFHIPVLQRTAPAALVISLLLLIGHMRMFPL